MGRSGKRLINSLTLSIKIPNKKQKTSIYITDITNQYFRNLLKMFNSLPYLCYKKKQIHNEPTEYYLFLIKNISKQIKIKKHVWLRTKIVRSSVNGK